MSTKTILIFDIDSSFRELLETIFEESPYSIASSDSSQNIIRQLDFYRPFMVLINTWMSGDNALNITHTIRQDLYFSRMTVVLMGTNFNLSELKKTSDADDFILQPFDIDELEQKINIYSHQLIS